MSGLYERKAKSEKKHPCSTSSQAAFRPSVQPPVNRPNWKGPSYVHKKPKQNRPAHSPSAQVQSTIQEQLLSQKLQQILLNIFKTTFPASNDFEALKPVLQEVKNALFERDFERAFGEQRFLEAYAMRWSPSRALGYGNLLAWIVEEFCYKDAWCRRVVKARPDSAKRRLQPDVVCLGGGPAEIVAFAGMLRYLASYVIEESFGKPDNDAVRSDELADGVKDLSLNENNSKGSEEVAKNDLLSIHLVDSAPWSPSLTSLDNSITTPPELSKYASAAAKASNQPLLPPWAMTTKFTQADVLNLSSEDMDSTFAGKPKLITLFFTLNELYTTSIPRTTKFLLDMSSRIPPGSVLLVVDSPGSYSEMAIKKTAAPAQSVSADNEVEGGEKTVSESASEAKDDVADDAAAYNEETRPTKKYPMHWLLDHALLGNSSGPQKPVWEKVVKEDSRWFRLIEGLKYPVCLENMRFQVHMFRRLKEEEE